MKNETRHVVWLELPLMALFVKRIWQGNRLSAKSQSSGVFTLVAEVPLDMISRLFITEYRG